MSDREGEGEGDAADGHRPWRRGSKDEDVGGGGGGDGRRRRSRHRSRDDGDDGNDDDGDDDDPNERLRCIDGGERASVESVVDARNNQIEERARAERVGRRWQGMRSVAPALTRILRRRRETTQG